MKSIKTVYLTKAAIIAALYAALTLLSSSFGLSFGRIQFRISEALCILPLFTGASIPGLTVGCLAANLFSTVHPLDAVFGTLATLLSAVLTGRLSGIRIGKIPVLSFLSPALVNGMIVGLELTLFASGTVSFWSAFAVNAVSVFLGEAAVLCLPGLALFFAIQKNARILKMLERS